MRNTIKLFILKSYFAFCWVERLYSLLYAIIETGIRPSVMSRMPAHETVSKVGNAFSPSELLCLKPCSYMIKYFLIQFFVSKVSLE